MPFKVIKGIKQAGKILDKEKPSVIFSKGGFVAIPTVIAGARSVSQVEKNAKAMHLKLTESEISVLDGISEDIKQKMGANLDPWRSKGGPAEPKIR
jgi:hypothetical protein